MPIRRSAAPLAFLAALALAGCTAPEPEPTPTAAPTTEPLFASEEEALAAAEEAYSEYLNASDAIFNSGGQDVEALRPLVSADLYAQRVEGFQESAAEGVSGSGATDFYIERLQSYESRGDRPQSITAYVCRDVSEVEVIDSEGRSLVASDRLEVIPMEVAWSTVEGQLVVAKDEPWASNNFCTS